MLEKLSTMKNKSEKIAYFKKKNNFILKEIHNRNNFASLHFILCTVYFIQYDNGDMLILRKIYKL